MLDLSNNRNLVNIEPGCFNNCNSLTHLFLNNCNLEQLSRNTFIGLNNIEVIKLNNNKNLVNIEPGCFNNFEKLAMISFQNCNLQILFQSTFENLISLEHINLSDNEKLINIESGCLIGCNHSVYINLRNCNLQIINNYLFGKTKEKFNSYGIRLSEYPYPKFKNLEFNVSKNKLLNIYSILGLKKIIDNNYLGNENSDLFNLIRSDTSDISHYDFCLMRYNITYRENFKEFILIISGISNVMLKENIVIIFFILMYHILDINIFKNLVSLRENIIIFLENYLNFMKTKNLNRIHLFSNNIINKIRNYIGLYTDILNYNETILKIIYELVNLYKYSPYFDSILSLYLDIEKYNIENHIFKKRGLNKLYLSSLIIRIRYDLTIPKNISPKDINLLSNFVRELLCIKKIKGLNELKTIIHTIKNIKRNLKKSLNSIHTNHNKIKIVIDYFNNLSDIFIREVILNDEKLDFKITNKEDLLILISLIHGDFRIPKNISLEDINLLYDYVQELLDIKEIKEIKTIENFQQIIPKIIEIKDRLKEFLNSTILNHIKKEKIINYFDDISNFCIRKIIPENNKLHPKILYS